MSLPLIRTAESRLRWDRVLAVALALAFAGYVCWKISQSADQALQFAFNGIAVGAVYALVAMGFTLVYSTVWFFDLYYGAAAALGAYGVFYLRSHDTLGGRYEMNHLAVNLAFAIIVAGVAAWALNQRLRPRIERRFGRNAALSAVVALALAAGAHVGAILSLPRAIHLTTAPLVGVLAAACVWLILSRAVLWRVSPSGGAGTALRAFAAALSLAVGAAAGFLIASAPGAGLYLSWGVSCLLAGAVSLALYRGLYMRMRARARSPLTMLVASLGILLAITALISIVFQPTSRPLPDAFGGAPWSVAGATIKGFNVFTIGVALAGFAALWLLLRKTNFGKAVRAIGDDEEVARVVGINAPVIISAVFFIGAVFAAMGGLLSGHDTAIQPRMGLLLLLKGWIASVVGGIGNLHGAIVGGFALGVIEQFGIWDLAGEWRDAISFVLLILFLSFWPNGVLPRK